MKSRKSFSLSISFSFSLKFKNVSQLAFTYSNSTIKSQELCLNVCKLLQILIATPCNTLCAERGYSLLQIVCAPRRNHLKPEHLDALFLLVALKLPKKKKKLKRL